jgi:hypothetical protein
MNGIASLPRLRRLAWKSGEKDRDAGMCKSLARVLKPRVPIFARAQSADHVCQRARSRIWEFLPAARHERHINGHPPVCWNSRAYPPILQGGLADGIQDARARVESVCFACQGRLNWLWVSDDLPEAKLFWDETYYDGRVSLAKHKDRIRPRRPLHRSRVLLDRQRQVAFLRLAKY